VWVPARLNNGARAGQMDSLDPIRSDLSGAPPLVDEARCKYADVLGDWLVAMGYTHCFMVAGGGCMHLIDGFRSRFTCIPVVHEVTAGIAAEHFNECRSAGRAFALVTTGPGLTNIVSAVAACWAERRELLVIAGQVKSTDLLDPPLRQRGIQEVDGRAVMAPIAVQARCLSKPIGREEFESLVSSARGPHPGPVVIEVCLDVQGALVALETLEPPVAKAASGKEDSRNCVVRDLAAAINGARRPLLLLGGLLSRRVAWGALTTLERIGIPVMTTTSAIDRVPSASPIAAGRPGTWGGQRAANVILAQADVIVAVGAQLDLQQTGFNWREYAPAARLFQVYPCRAELGKGHPPLAAGYDVVPDDLFPALLDAIDWQDVDGWGEYVRRARRLMPTLERANEDGRSGPSAFRFLRELSLATRSDDVLALCSSGGTFTGALQVYEVARNQHATTSPAFASMGWGLASAIGVAFARPGQRVVLSEGDGGFAQNLQELAIVRRHALPVKMFLLDNGGYASIRATQRKFFQGAYVGCDEATGLGFPDWVALFRAYGIPAEKLPASDMTADRLAVLMDRPGPAAWVVEVDPDQPNFPAVTSRILPDGSMESNPISRQQPPLTPEIEVEVTRYLPPSA
jgi:acetolactate synthase-1/2/3 large subunit